MFRTDGTESLFAGFFYQYSTPNGVFSVTLLALTSLNTVIYTVPLLHQFLDKLTRLKRGVTKYGTAPHKPVLLLAFIDLFDKGLLTQNQVYVDADLVGALPETGACWWIPRTPPILHNPFITCKATSLTASPFGF